MVTSTVLDPSRGPYNEPVKWLLSHRVQSHVFLGVSLLSVQAGSKSMSYFGGDTLCVIRHVQVFQFIHGLITTSVHFVPLNTEVHQWYFCVLALMKHVVTEQMC